MCIPEAKKINKGDRNYVATKKNVITEKPFTKTAIVNR